MKKIILFLLLFPAILFAQELDKLEPDEVLSHNQSIVEQFAQVTSMSINPYTSVFLTSACSKLGFSNDYVKTHPFYNSWFVVSIFGFIFLFTLIIRPSLGLSKSLSVLKLADEHLEDNAILVINGIIILLPVVMSDVPNGEEVVFEAGILSIDFKAILITVVSTYYLIIVIALRQFIDFLVFLSPIPFVDSFLEIAKIVMTSILVIISIYSPITSFIIAIIFFLIGLLLYRRGKRFNNKVSYIFQNPIFNLFKKKRKILFDSEGNFSIKILNKTKTKKFKRGKILKLEKNENNIQLKKNRFLFPNKTEILDLENCSITLTNLDILIECNGDMKFVVNRSYHKYIDDLSEILKPENTVDNRTKFTKARGFIGKVKQMFSKKEITNFKRQFKHS